MIAIIKAQFNSHITDLLEAGCTEYLAQHNLPLKAFECPGAVETVVYANKLISTGKYKSIIVIGAIIKGDTDHYEYVCQYVTNGISQLSALHTTPIIFARSIRITNIFEFRMTVWYGSSGSNPHIMNPR